MNRHSHIVRKASVASVTRLALEGGGVPASSTTAIQVRILMRLVPGLAAFVFGSGEVDKMMSRLCPQSFTLRPKKAGAILSPSTSGTEHHLKYQEKTFLLTRAIWPARSGVIGRVVAGEVILPLCSAV